MCSVVIRVQFQSHYIYNLMRPCHYSTTSVHIEYRIIRSAAVFIPVFKNAISLIQWLLLGFIEIFHKVIKG